MPDGLPPFPEDDAALARQLQRANLTGDPLGYAIGMVVRAVREAKALGAALLQAMAELRAAKGQAPAVSDEAMERASKGIAAGAGRHLALAYPWAVGGALAVAVCAGAGVGYGIGRHALAAEVRLVEQGLALSLPAGSAWLEIARNNRAGPAVYRKRQERGGEITDGGWWSVPPAPDARAAR